MDSKKIQVTCISDTHGYHRRLNLEGGDILIHAGDIEAKSFQGLVDFMLWFEDQDYKHKIFIGGNHDFFLQESTNIAKKHIENKDIIYLQDELVVIPYDKEIGYVYDLNEELSYKPDYLKIWGSPWALPFHNWAFMKPQEELDKIYEQIPDDIDILITHSPPHNSQRGIVTSGEDVGVKVLPRVPYTICGHIHEGYGRTYDAYHETYVFNCSVLNEQYKLVNKPITFEI